MQLTEDPTRMPGQPRCCHNNSTTASSLHVHLAVHFTDRPHWLWDPILLSLFLMALVVVPEVWAGSYILD